MAPEPCLVVSLSARGLVRAAMRAGHRVACIDAFADADTRRMAAAWARLSPTADYGLEPRALLRRAAALCPPDQGGALVYGSGFEASPETLARLAEGRELLGNMPEVLAHCGDPTRFFPLLDDLKLPHPKVSLECPPLRRGWLSKKAGACGGTHILRASACGNTPGRYFQRHIRGEACSLLFLADGEKMLPVGFNRALPAPPDAPSPWAYAGAVRMDATSLPYAGELLDAARTLTRALGLRGLNGMDFIHTGEDWKLLELNPRPTATLSLWDVRPMPSLFRLHMEACRGRLPARLPQPAGSLASAVVYAGNDVRIPFTFQWPDWCADLPSPGSTVAAGEPLCTVTSAGHTPEVAAHWAAEMRASLLRRLGIYTPSAFQAPARAPQAVPA